MAALFDSVPRLLLVATACALVAVVVGALGVKFRFAGARAARGGTALGLVVLAQSVALALAWAHSGGVAI